MPQDSDPISAVIERGLAAARAGAGSTVLVSAPAGRGTSHQLGAAAESAVASGMALGRTVGRPAERSLAFSAAVELLEAPWLDAPPVTVAGSAADAGRAGPALALLRGVDPPAAREDGGLRVIRGMWHLVRQLAAHPGHDGRPRGLALIVDDLHDVDGPSLRLLAYAAGRLREEPVALIIGCRPEIEAVEPSVLAAIFDQAHVMSPPGLSDADARTLVRSQLPEASAPFCAACALVSGANPGLLRALGTELATAGWIGSDREIDAIAGVLPEPVTAIVAARLKRLPESARELVTAVAALGPGASMEVATATAGLTPEAARRALDPLVLGEFLRPLLPLDFVAPIVQSAVRAILTPGQRVGMRSILSRVPNVPADRLATLTPSELRVAEFAARGMTTKEIASSLFVTSKTIEFHLSNIYRKLELPSSRAELSRALGAVLAAIVST